MLDTKLQNLRLPDLIQVVNLAFVKFPAHARLWAWSGQTLRQRFKDVLSATERHGDLKALDLGSLRAGGATWHLMMTENSEYTRRKGRWLSSRVMEIYVQETAALLFLKRVPADTKEKVLAIAGLFPRVLATALRFEQLQLPHHVWPVLFRQEEL